MQSKKSAAMLGLLRSVKPVICNLNLDLKRAGSDFLGKLKKMPPDLRVAPAPGPRPAEWIVPAKERGDRVILYSHGGAYEGGSLTSSRALASVLAQDTGRRVLSYDYRLAPEHPFPAALDDALAVFRHLCREGIEPGRIVLAGDSAGGGLSLALALCLKDRDEPLPGGIVCLSPWTDLTGSVSSHRTRAQDDPIIESEGLHLSALHYAAGTPLGTPYLSPVYGDLAGFPPVLIQACSRQAATEVPSSTSTFRWQSNKFFTARPTYRNPFRKIIAFPIGAGSNALYRTRFATSFAKSFLKSESICSVPI